MKTKPLALIVDDNFLVRETVEDHVAELEHDFHSVGSQHEACEHLDLHTYDYSSEQRTFSSRTRE